MMQLPRSTQVQRILPKEKFYAKTTITPQLRQLFVEQIDKILWTNKLSPQTLNIHAETYPELEIFEITLKGAELHPSVLQHIDAFIPYPILFLLKKPGLEKAVLSFKEPTTAKTGAMKVLATFATDWQPSIPLELKGLSTNDIYRHFLQQIAPALALKDYPDIHTALDAYQARQKIQKQIDALARAILREPSTAKQQDLARERFALKQQLENGVYLNRD